MSMRDVTVMVSIDKVKVILKMVQGNYEDGQWSTSSPDNEPNLFEGPYEDLKIARDREFNKEIW